MYKVNSKLIILVFFTPNDSSPSIIHCAVVAKIHFIMNYEDYFTLFV